MLNKKRFNQIWGLVALFLMLMSCSGQGVEPMTVHPIALMVTPTPLILSPTSTDTPVSEPEPTTETPSLVLNPAPRISQVGPFKLYEYPLVAVEESDEPDLPYDAFDSYFPNEFLPNIFPWQSIEESMDAYPNDLLMESNRILSPFDYRLEFAMNTIFGRVDVYHHDELLKADAFLWGVPALNQSGTDFALAVSTDDDVVWLIRRDSVESRDSQAYGLAPIFIGDTLIEAYYEGSAWYKQQNNKLVKLEDEFCMETDCIFGNPYTLRADGKIIYTRVFTTPVVNYHLLGLWNWNNHWVLEAERTLVIDGKSLNDQFGYTSAFDWNLFAGKPFYFFEKRKQVGFVYDGKSFSMPYHHIVYEIPCCNAGRYNPSFLADRIVFFARRDKLWYYVELRLDGSSG